MKIWHPEDADSFSQVIDIKSLNEHEDILLNNFDLGWSKFINDKDFLKQWTVLPSEPFDDGEIIYNFNSDRFRCDEFLLNHNNKTHMLFAGCSETEGIGSPINTVWSKIIYDNLSTNNELSGYFALGKAGWGWQKIINNFLVYSKKYGYPDCLVVLLPRISRYYNWNNSKWEYQQNFFKVRNNTFTKEDHHNLWINFIMGWKLFELFCESVNVKLVWSTWDYLENENIEKTDKLFNSFFAIKDFHILEHFKYIRPNGELMKYDIDRRDGHNGIIEHSCYSKLFLEYMRHRSWFD